MYVIVSQSVTIVVPLICGGHKRKVKGHIKKILAAPPPTCKLIASSAPLDDNADAKRILSTLLKEN